MDDGFFLRNTFGIRNVNTKTFILLLAQQNPRSMVSGMPIDVNAKLKDYNNAEFHHMMPKAFVRLTGDTEVSVNCLANYCFLSRSENKQLGGARPSQYRAKLPENTQQVLQHAVCPMSLFSDIIDVFARDRASMLAEKARELIEQS